MKHLKSINELYDDTNQHIDKEDLKYIMTMPELDRKKTTNKPYINIPSEMYDDSETNRVSTMYKFDHDLKNTIPYLKKFEISHQEEKKDGFKIFYDLEKEARNVDFGLKLDVYVSSKEKRFLLNPYIIRKEKIRLNDPGFRVLNQDMVDKVEDYIETIKNKYGISDETAIMKKMEEYYWDIQDGHVLNFDDDVFAKNFGFYKTTKTEDEKEILHTLSQNIKLYDDYTKKMLNVSLFN